MQRLTLQRPGQGVLGGQRRAEGGGREEEEGGWRRREGGGRGVRASLPSLGSKLGPLVG